MFKRRWVRILLGIIGFITLLIGGVVFYWMQQALGPDTAALAALESTDQVIVTELDSGYRFEPAGEGSGVGLVYYPGGGVDYRSYAPMLAQVAEGGHTVFLVPVPLNLAFFDLQAAAPIVEAYPEIDRWAVGGHSLGGVAAATYAAGDPEIDGVVFHASYPAGDALVDRDLVVSSIYGTLDGLSTIQDIEESKALLPADAVFVPIEGGNHAQFGDYGFQDRDNAATISAEAQWELVAAATVEFLEAVEAGSTP